MGTSVWPRRSATANDSLVRAARAELADHKKLCHKCHAAKRDVTKLCDVGYELARTEHLASQAVARARVRREDDQETLW